MVNKKRIQIYIGRRWVDGLNEYEANSPELDDRLEKLQAAKVKHRLVNASELYK